MAIVPRDAGGGFNFGQDLLSDQIGRDTLVTGVEESSTVTITTGNNAILTWALSSTEFAYTTLPPYLSGVGTNTIKIRNAGFYSIGFVTKLAISAMSTAGGRIFVELLATDNSTGSPVTISYPLWQEVVTPSSTITPRWVLASQVVPIGWPDATLQVRITNSTDGTVAVTTSDAANLPTLRIVELSSYGVTG